MGARSKINPEMSTYTIEKGVFTQTVRILNFQRRDMFILREVDVAVARLLCANEDTEFGKEAKEARKRNHLRRGARCAKGLHNLVALLENADTFSFDHNGCPLVIREMEITGIQVDHLWDALRFLGFAVSIFIHSCIFYSIERRCNFFPNCSIIIQNI